LKECFRMWSNTRMVVLVAISAAVYAAVLIPFKAIQIVPGLAEIRPAAALPPLCSMLFGPAGAWGAAFGNLIGDFFGMLGPGSLFGFVGNFLYGYIPYKVWQNLGGKDIKPGELRTWLRLEMGFFMASMSCGVFIGWGADLLGLAPFKVLGNIIVIQNCLVSMIISPFLVFLLYPMINNWGLSFQELLDIKPKGASALKILGLALVLAGAAGGLVIGNLVSFQVIDLSTVCQAATSIRWVLIPFIMLILAGCAML
jgi:energy-coupling factor transport system substrate-specific component